MFNKHLRIRQLQYYSITFESSIEIHEILLTHLLSTGRSCVLMMQERQRLSLLLSAIDTHVRMMEEAKEGKGEFYILSLNCRMITVELLQWIRFYCSYRAEG